MARCLRLIADGRVPDQASVLRAPPGSAPRWLSPGPLRTWHSWSDMAILDWVRQVLESLSKDAEPAAFLGGVAGLGVGTLLVVNGVFAEAIDRWGEPVMWVLATVFRRRRSKGVRHGAAAQETAQLRGRVGQLKKYTQTALLTSVPPHHRAVPASRRTNRTAA